MGPPTVHLSAETFVLRFWWFFCYSWSYFFVFYSPVCVLACSFLTNHHWLKPILSIATAWHPLGGVLTGWASEGAAIQGVRSTSSILLCGLKVEFWRSEMAWRSQGWKQQYKYLSCRADPESFGLFSNCNPKCEVLKSFFAWKHIEFFDNRCCSDRPHFISGAQSLFSLWVQGVWFSSWMWGFQTGITAHLSIMTRGEKAINIACFVSWYL